MELLISLVENGLTDQHVKVGHVIEVRPSGAWWSPLERGNPDWRIVRCDMKADEAYKLLTPGDGQTLIVTTQPTKVPGAQKKYSLHLDHSNQSVGTIKEVHIEDLRRGVRS